MIYAGIGSRDTPQELLPKIQAIGRFMARWHHTLRSGGAKGADAAFEAGCDELGGTKEIYLPYKGFNANPSPLHHVTIEARRIAKEFHPNWPVLGDRGRDFMGRNAYQILGLKLDRPADFVVCWTPGGKIRGGTGQALRMAAHFGIPVFNLGAMGLDEINEKLITFLNGDTAHA